MALAQIGSEYELNLNTYAKFLSLHYCKRKCNLSIPKGVASSSKRVATIRTPNKLKIPAANDRRVIQDVIGQLILPKIAD